MEKKAKAQSSETPTKNKKLNGRILLPILAVTCLVLSAGFLGLRSYTKQKPSAESILLPVAEEQEATNSGENRVKVTSQSQTTELNTNELLVEINARRIQEGKVEFVQDDRLVSIAQSMANDIKQYYIANPGTKINDTAILSDFFEKANTNGTADIFTAGLQTSCVLDARSTVLDAMSHTESYLNNNTFGSIGIGINFNSWGACDLVYVLASS